MTYETETKPKGLSLTLVFSISRLFWFKTLSKKVQQPLHLPLFHLIFLTHSWDITHLPSPPNIGFIYIQNTLRTPPLTRLETCSERHKWSPGKEKGSGYRVTSFQPAGGWKHPSIAFWWTLVTVAKWWKLTQGTIDRQMDKQNVV